jgi:hypothetical protein
LSKYQTVSSVSGVAVSTLEARLASVVGAEFAGAAVGAVL